MNTTNSLSGQALLSFLYHRFQLIDDPRASNTSIALCDALMSAYAMFSLKFSSLLQFEEDTKKRKMKSNLKSIYHIQKIPSDTQMRAIIDSVPSGHLHPIFQELFEIIKKNKALKPYVFNHHNGRPHYLVAVDGTQYFNSHNVMCESCMKKKSKKNGITYYHQILGSAIIHPDHKTVIPIAPEPILNQDGHVKNDCEFNAFQRYATKFRKDHPKLNVIIAGDSLYAKGALIKILQGHKMSYILNVKPGGNKKLFSFIEGSDRRGYVHYHEFKETVGNKIKKHVTHKFRYKNSAPIDNASSLELRVNFLEYWEITEWKSRRGEIKREEKHFSWVTDLYLDKRSVEKVMRGGRGRWTIENEVFNTLKNQGYNFEHNFGHGYNNLSTNFSFLMMLAFFIDQIQEMGCKLFQRVLIEYGRKRTLWRHLLSSYLVLPFESWEFLLRFLLENSLDTS